MGQRRAGFTLTELLVVIAIITVLAAILLPALQGARERGRMTTCVNNLRQIVQAFEMYAGDCYERFPGDGSDLYAGAKPIYPEYIKSGKVFWCPTSAIRGVTSADQITATNWYASYAFVFGLSTSNRATGQVPVVSDRGLYNPTLDLNKYPNLPDDTDLRTGNHQTGINTIYLDGSARFVKLNEIVFSEDDDTVGLHSMGTVACTKTGLSPVIDTDADRTAWGE